MFIPVLHKLAEGRIFPYDQFCLLRDALCQFLGLRFHGQLRAGALGKQGQDTGRQGADRDQHGDLRDDTDSVSVGAHSLFRLSIYCGFFRECPMPRTHFLIIREKAAGGKRK